MSFVKFLLIILFVMLLSACGTNNTKIKEFLKCALAAQELEQKASSIQISKLADKFVEENNIPYSARSTMLLAEEVRNDLNLQDKNLTGQYFKLLKVYNSSVCQKMHTQGKLGVPWGYYFSYIFM